MKHCSIFVAKSVGVLLLLIGLYFLSALILSNIEVNSDFKPCEKDPIPIYILSNGVHTDIVVPLKNKQMDWSAFVDPKNTQGGDTSKINVAFGWGDKGFYLQTKTWDDLKFSTAFNALFYLSTSAMHVSFYRNLKEDEECKKILISQESYTKLILYIKNSFKKSAEDKVQQIPDAFYKDNDAFYEGEGAYSLFYTCNTWTNEGLKSANIKACLWTPYCDNILELHD